MILVAQKLSIASAMAAATALLTLGFTSNTALSQPAPTESTPAAPETATTPGAKADTTDLDQPVDAEGDPIYIVRDGKVDRGTYNGYRRYHSICQTCHGFDVTGSSFAPTLIDSLKRMDLAGFREVVINGKKSTGATGDRVMPSFGMDPNVTLHLDDIYRYVKARSDNAIPPGRPVRLTN